MAGRCRQTPTMRFDYRSTNRQSHSHPVGFRRKECVENALHVAWINPCARVFQHDLHVMGFVHFRLYSQNSFAISDRTHCIDGVHDQVNEHLLQLHPLGHHLWKIVEHLIAQRYLVTLQFPVYERENFANKIGHAYSALSWRSFPNIERMPAITSLARFASFPICFKISRTASISSSALLSHCEPA